MIGRWRTQEVSESSEPKSFDDFELRLGDLMRGERATLGKSLLDVQRELKIKAPYIAAIENADPSAFESPGFIAGYVRSYARYLGMDPEWAYNTFCAEADFAVAHGLSIEASSVKPQRRDYSGDPLANPNASFVPRGESVFAGIEPGAVGSVAALMALIGVIGFGGWAVLKEVQQVEFAPVEQSAGALSNLEDFSGANTEIADITGGAGLNTPPNVDALDRLYRPQALDVPVLVARDGPISTLDPRVVGVLADTGPSPTAPSLASPTLGDPTGLAAAVDEAVTLASAGTASSVQVFGADAPEVAIFAVRPSWVRVQSADGSIIFEKILEAGERYVLPATELPPVLRSGNAGSVYFAVNGTAYGPAGVGPSVVKNIELSSQALADNFTVADLDKDADLKTYVAEAQSGE